MRHFSSYGPIDKDLYYYVPRKELIEKGYTQLMGTNPMKGGHYITVWAPRQCGKTWTMVQIYQQLKKDSRFDVVQVSLEIMKDKTSAAETIESLARLMGNKLGKSFSGIDTQEKFQELFRKGTLEKPLILILDEFDALLDDAISAIVSAFRNIHIDRQYESDKPTEEKSYLLHAVALIGIRSVLGIENVKGSPFNVQRSIHIPNLTYEEVDGMFKWYEKESGQKIEQDVIDRLFYETNGQPGLISWFGELLTETYNEEKNKPITLKHFEDTFIMALSALPNNNILNIISKAKIEPYKQKVLELFETDEKTRFSYDDVILNFLYLNGVIDREKGGTDLHVKFASPFVQKRLFNYFSVDLFSSMGQLHEPFENLDNAITDTDLNIKNLAKLYETYLKKNSSWLLEDVPRRKDLRVYEAVFHFNLYSYLDKFLRSWGARVVPEFPTGNGKIDLIITHAGKTYGVELKTYSTERNYKEALTQAAKYGKQLELAEISLVFFVEYADEKSREKYEKEYRDKETKVTVKPIFIETGHSARAVHIKE